MTRDEAVDKLAWELAGPEILRIVQALSDSGISREEINRVWLPRLRPLFKDILASARIELQMGLDPPPSSATVH